MLHCMRQFGAFFISIKLLPETMSDAHRWIRGDGYIPKVTISMTPDAIRGDSGALVNT